MVLGLTFDSFIKIIKQVVHFEKDWDVDDWNEQYINFKEGLRYYSKDYLDKTETLTLVRDWAVDFYQDAKPNTHNYWVKKGLKTVK